VFHSVVRWRDGLPQYRLGHLDAMQRARQALQSQCPGLVLAGNYLGGIGATAAAASGLAAVEELAASGWAAAPGAAAGTATEVRSAT
jgi:oxygen-dependent protoporphyrinogen oxidase